MSCLSPANCGVGLQYRLPNYSRSMDNIHDPVNYPCPHCPAILPPCNRIHPQLLQVILGCSANIFPDEWREKAGPVLDFFSSSVATVVCSVVSTPQMVITDRESSSAIVQVALPHSSALLVRVRGRPLWSYGTKVTIMPQTQQPLYL